MNWFAAAEKKLERGFPQEDVEDQVASFFGIFRTLLDSHVALKEGCWALAVAGFTGLSIICFLRSQGWTFLPLPLLIALIVLAGIAAIYPWSFVRNVLEDLDRRLMQRFELSRDKTR